MIKLEGVYKNYGAIRVLEGIDLQVEEGKPLCLWEGAAAENQPS